MLSSLYKDVHTASAPDLHRPSDLTHLTADVADLLKGLLQKSPLDRFTWWVRIMTFILYCNYIIPIVYNDFSQSILIVVCICPFTLTTLITLINLFHYLYIYTPMYRSDLLVHPFWGPYVQLSDSGTGLSFPAQPCYDEFIRYVEGVVYILVM